MSTQTVPTERVMIVIEYSFTECRVIVRGAFYEGDTLPAPLHPGNVQNKVSVWLGADMGHHVGFSGLVPGEKEPTQ